MTDATAAATPSPGPVAVLGGGTDDRVFFSAPRTPSL